MSEAESKRPLAEPVEEEAPDAAELLRGVLHDERFEPGTIVLDRQEVPLADDGLPAYVKEETPTRSAAPTSISASSASSAGRS